MSTMLHGRNYDRNVSTKCCAVSCDELEPDLLRTLLKMIPCHRAKFTLRVRVSNQSSVLLPPLAERRL